MPQGVAARPHCRAGSGTAGFAGRDVDGPRAFAFDHVGGGAEASLGVLARRPGARGATVLGSLPPGLLPGWRKSTCDMIWLKQSAGQCWSSDEGLALAPRSTFASVRFWLTDMDGHHHLIGGGLSASQTTHALEAAFRTREVK